jgi:hypothetical protein
MKRNKIIGNFNHDKLLEQKQRIAFHEAGHAAGIHLNNKAKQLPPVFFKIFFNDTSGLAKADGMSFQSDSDEYIARVEGGRLIELLPSSFGNFIQELTEHNNDLMQLTHDYIKAFEADIINLLIGPLAEARYVASIDDELFNHKLVNLYALKNYGGNSDIALAHDYLQSFSTDEQQKEDKLAELFAEAYRFINNDANWAAITKLADYMLSSSKNIIYCDEIVSMLDLTVALFQNKRLSARYLRPG